MKPALELQKSEGAAIGVACRPAVVRPLVVIVDAFGVVVSVRKAVRNGVR